ncbi:MAG: hypothetical protein AAB919_02980 [Patescibacteria group bacterium]
MDSKTLISALTTCADRLRTAKGVYVLHHGVNFAESVEVDSVMRPDVGATLSKLIGMDIKVRKPGPFAAGAKNPMALSVREHIQWMVDEAPKKGDLNLRCWWIGFAAGAAARANLHSRYYRKDVFDTMDMPNLIKFAESHATAQHYFAHMVLGYLQGWLWADGQSSINDFNRMNAA